MGWVWGQSCSSTATAFPDVRCAAGLYHSQHTTAACEAAHEALCSCALAAARERTHMRAISHVACTHACMPGS